MTSIEHKGPTTAPVLQIYDQPMCCSTGVCGTDVDPTLVNFSADLDWLTRHGVVVERYNPSHDPRAFVTNPVVRNALQESNGECLPLVLWGGAVVSAGGYPDRTRLATTVGLASTSSVEPEGAA